MWTRNPSRRRASSGGSGTAFGYSPSPSHPCFSNSSLKDLHSILAEAPDELSPRPSVFHRVRIATSALRTWRSLSSPAPSPVPKRLVLYFTSLRVIRKTFDDCRLVRSILWGLRVAVDERDVSMDSRFLEELKAILRKGEVRLPMVFIGGRCVGGAEEVRQLHETGELRRRLEGVPPAPVGSCELCAGLGFVLCQSCDGSRKLYSEKGGGGFRSCAACNENGLARCPDCRRSETVRCEFDGADLLNG